MDGWMDEWTETWMDDEWINGQRMINEGWMDQWMDDDGWMEMDT